MEIIIKTKKNRKFTFKIKTILRNILIILAIIIISKYIKFMSNYNTTQLEIYSQFVEYAQEKDIAITQTNYQSYIQSHINK